MSLIDTESPLIQKILKEGFERRQHPAKKDFFVNTEGFQISIHSESGKITLLNAYGIVIKVVEEESLKEALDLIS